MDKPTCSICGAKEWAHVCGGSKSKSPKKSAIKDETFELLAERVYALETRLDAIGADALKYAKRRATRAETISRRFEAMRMRLPKAM